MATGVVGDQDRKGQGMRRTVKVMAVAAAMTALSAGTALATSDPFVHGTNGPDTFSGTAQPDSFRGWDGSDRVFGRGGGDYLYGDSGRDVVAGGSGTDFLYGGSGGDFIDGLTRNGDPAYPEEGKDTIRCGAGEDTVVANALDEVAPDCEHVSRGGGDGG